MLASMQPSKAILRHEPARPCNLEPGQKGGPSPLISKGLEGTTTEEYGFAPTLAGLVRWGQPAYCGIELEQTMTLECKVCLAEHDEEIHDATRRVHAWFRAQVIQDFEDASGELALREGEELDLPESNAA